MAKHVKPTPEELEANAQKALEEAEALEAQAKKDKEAPEDEPEDTPEDTPDENPDDDQDDTPDDDDSGDDEEETPPAKPKTPETPPKKEKTTEEQLAEKDKKLKASSREAQILYARNKQVQEAIQKASEMPDPTDEEMQAEYSDWDVMSDFEKKMARESEASKRRLKAITDVNQQFKDLESWQNQVDTFMDNPQTLIDNPALEGRIEDFKEFATRPTRRGVDFDILISSFLYQIDSEKPTKKKKKSMFPSGSGGEATRPPKPNNKISIEQARQLRKNNYSEYKRLLLEGKIDDSDL